MFKQAARPRFAATVETLSPSAARLGGCSCRTSIRLRVHSIHSTARVSAVPRPDHDARSEFYGAGGADLRGVMKYRRYRESRDLAVAAESREDDGRSIMAKNNLPGLLEGFQGMAKSGRKPSREAYLALLGAAADYSVERCFTDAAPSDNQLLRNSEAGSEFLGEQGETGLGWQLAWCTWQDARLGDVDLGIEGLDLLIKAANPHPQLLSSLLHYALDTPSIASNLTTETYGALLREPIRAANIDHLTLLLYEIRARGTELPVGRAGQIISIAAEHGLVRLALDLARHEEGEYGSDLETQVWVDILRTSADRYFIDGVEAAWDRVVRTGDFDPDEGLCTIVIGVAGRHNRPDLATSVMENLGRQGIVPKEYHFPPLLEALCGSGRVSDAMEVLTAMRRSGFHADLVAAEPIVGALSKSADDVDKGFYGLQALRTTGKQVDVAAFNAVLKAAETLGDANRAMVIYRQAEGLGVVPNLETYHVLLSACASAGAVPQAEYLLGDMEKRGDGVADGVTTTSLSSSFDATTYALLVDLYLTGSDYEKAFEYLEVMKTKGIRPPLSVYEGLVKKCVAEGDSRSQPLLQEMQAGQYKPSATLIEYVRRVAGAGSRRSEGGEGGGHEKKPRRVESSSPSSSSSGPRRSSRTSSSISEFAAKGEARKGQESTEGVAE